MGETSRIDAGGASGTHELPKDILPDVRMAVIEVTDVCASDHAIWNARRVDETLLVQSHGEQVSSSYIVVFVGVCNPIPVSL